MSSVTLRNSSASRLHIHAYFYLCLYNVLHSSPIYPISPISLRGNVGRPPATPKLQDEWVSSGVGSGVIAHNKRLGGGSSDLLAGSTTASTLPVSVTGTVTVSDWDPQSIDGSGHGSGGSGSKGFKPVVLNVGPSSRRGSQVELVIATSDAALYLYLYLALYVALDVALDVALGLALLDH